MAEYVLAIKREARDAAPSDWLDQLQRIPGVTLTTTSPGRAQVDVDDDDAHQRLVDSIGSFCHVEPLIPHHVRQRSAPIGLRVDVADVGSVLDLIEEP